MLLTLSLNSPGGEKDPKIDDDPIAERAKLNSHNNGSPDADNVNMLGNSSNQTSEVSQNIDIHEAIAANNMHIEADNVSAINHNKLKLLDKESHITKTSKERLTPIRESFNYDEIIATISDEWNRSKNAPYFSMSNNSNSSFSVVFNEKLRSNIASLQDYNVSGSENNVQHNKNNLVLINRAPENPLRLRLPNQISNQNTDGAIQGADSVWSYNHKDSNGADEANASILGAANCPPQSDAYFVATYSGVVNCPAKSGSRPKYYQNSGMHCRYQH